MKHHIFSLALCIAAFASCSEVQPSTAPDVPSSVETKMVELSFTAGIDTKTHLSGKDVVWSKGDAISVFANGTNYQFTTQDEGASATFTGSVSAEDAAATTTYYALYPYDATATIASNVISAKAISASQGQVTGTFPNNRNQAVAESVGTSFSFKNVCAVLKVTVPESMDGLLKTMMISSNNGESFVAGTLDITVEDTPSITNTGLTSGDFQINKNAGIPAGDYYIPVYPVEMVKGLRIKLIYVDLRTSEYIFSGKSITLERNQIFNVGTLYQQPSFVYENFESYSVSETGVTTLASYISGNTSALLVVDNPCKSTTNPSDKVLADDMHTATWSTSGYVTFALTSDASKIKFPYAARDKYKGVRMKVYLGNNDYYPSLQVDNENKFPSKVNGVAISGSTDKYAENLKKDDWNVLEFAFSTCEYTFNNAASKGSYQLRPFVKSDKKSCDATLSDTNTKLVYIDDFEFIY